MVSILFLVSAAYGQNTLTLTVNCDNGQSLTRTLSELNKQTPTTVIVQGTCSELVTIDGFESLTLRGQSGAAIQQPVTNPHFNSNVLSITGSRGITVSNLVVHGPSEIGIGKGSSEVLLKDVDVDDGVVVYEESQVWLVKVNVNIISGFAAFQVYDKSDVHITGGMLKRASNGLWNVGLFVGSGHVTMQGTTIRDMQIGIDILGNGSVDFVNVNPVGGVDVTIENPAGTNINGVLVTDGSSLNLNGAVPPNPRLLISNAGQTWGGNSGAVFVTNGSTLDAGAGLVVSGTRGQGVIVTNNSHATLNGSSITGGSHGGLVVANLSTIDVQPSSSPTLVGGNAADLFCDSNSLITGTANLVGVSTVNCGNLLSGNTVPLP